MVKHKNLIKRKELRIYEKDVEIYEHWAQRDGLSFNEFMQQAADFYINWQLKDFDVPLATVSRINQLVASQTALVQTVQANTQITKDGFNSLFSLMGNESYLAKDTPTDYPK